jgi:hypothetical protein
MHYYDSRQSSMRLGATLWAIIFYVTIGGLFFLEISRDSLFWNNQFAISLLYPLTLITFIWYIFANLSPDVWLDASGIQISYNIFWKVKIPWKEVVSIKKLPLGVGSIIYARKMKIIYYFYGLYGLKLLTGFIVSKRTQNYEELIDNIQKSIENNV